MQALLFFACKNCSLSNRDNSLMVERHFGGGKGSIPFYFLPYAGDERRRYGNRVSNCRLYSNFPAGGNSGKSSETQTPLLREIDRRRDRRDREMVLYAG